MTMTTPSNDTPSPDRFGRLFELIRQQDTSGEATPMQTSDAMASTAVQANLSAQERHMLGITDCFGR